MPVRSHPQEALNILERCSDEGPLSCKHPAFESEAMSLLVHTLQ